MRKTYSKVCSLFKIKKVKHCGGGDYEIKVQNEKIKRGGVGIKRKLHLFGTELKNNFCSPHLPHLCKLGKKFISKVDGGGG